VTLDRGASAAVFQDGVHAVDGDDDQQHLLTGET
jgi:hypothetical protein